MKILIAQINPTIGDIAGNLEKIQKGIALAKQNGCELVVTPELALIGYPPQDLLFSPSLLQKAEEALEMLIQNSKGIGLFVGTVRKNPSPHEKPLYNTAAICYDGKLLGFQDKTLLPSYDVFNEKRYFEPASENQPWKIGKHTGAVTICEDIWQESPSAPIPLLGKHPLDIAVNLSASPFFTGKVAKRIEVVQKAANTLKCPMILCNQIGGNDSLIFDGYSVVVNGQGQLITLAQGFSEDYCVVELESTAPMILHERPLEDLHQALLLGLKDYFVKQGFKKACIGLSGGIDSALVACLAVEALGKENVLAVAMPSRYSSQESLIDARELANRLSIPLTIISIEEPFKAFLELLHPHFQSKPENATEENLQARIRGNILMALSNKHGYIVLSTGNKSELALGYSTLYGDMCGGLAVISDLTKLQVYALSRHINTKTHWIPDNILTKPPSAELRPNQKDSDSLPDYHIVDAVIKAYIEMGQSPEEVIKNTKVDEATVHQLIQKIHANEYKRRQSPPGLKVTEKAFSIGRHFPIVQKWVQ